MAKRVPRQSAQEMQDDIFRRMSADKKLRLGAQLWEMGKKIASKNPEEWLRKIRTSS